MLLLLPRRLLEKKAERRLVEVAPHVLRLSPPALGLVVLAETASAAFGSVTRTEGVVPAGLVAGALLRASGQAASVLGAAGLATTTSRVDAYPVGATAAGLGGEFTPRLPMAALLPALPRAPALSAMRGTDAAAEV